MKKNKQKKKNSYSCPVTCEIAKCGCVSQDATTCYTDHRIQDATEDQSNTERERNSDRSIKRELLLLIDCKRQIDK